MKLVRKEAIRRWKSALKHKLSGQKVGSKELWSSVKQQQIFTSNDTIPPLTVPDGGLAMWNKGLSCWLPTSPTKCRCLSQYSRPNIPEGRRRSSTTSQHTKLRWRSGSSKWTPKRLLDPTVSVSTCCADEQQNCRYFLLCCFGGACPLRRGSTVEEFEGRPHRQEEQ